MYAFNQLLFSVSLNTLLSFNVLNTLFPKKRFEVVYIIYMYHEKREETSTHMVQALYQHCKVGAISILQRSSSVSVSCPQRYSDKARIQVQL